MDGAISALTLAHQGSRRLNGTDVLVVLSTYARLPLTRPMNTNGRRFRGYRFAAEIICHGVWLYHRFSLSLGRLGDTDADADPESAWFHFVGSVQDEWPHFEEFVSRSERTLLLSTNTPGEVGPGSSSGPKPVLPRGLGVLEWRYR